MTERCAEPYLTRCAGSVVAANICINLATPSGVFNTVETDRAWSLYDGPRDHRRPSESNVMQITDTESHGPHDALQR